MDVSLMDVVMAVAIVLLTTYVVLKRGGSIQEVPGSLEHIADETRLWVEAAEQLYNSGQLPQGTDPGAAKAAYVMENLQRLFPQVDDETLKAAMEHSVFWLKKSLGKG